VFVETCGVGENEGVVGHAPHVCAGLRVIGIDGFEERFECCGGESFGTEAACALASGENGGCGDSAGGGDGNGGFRDLHDREGGKTRSPQFCESWQ